ncbi:MAG: DJ-1/PfpI family protein [Solobacterium sp.]|nr:DJ-1/PfpI family protein [Solobacterium sp.]
MNKTALFLAEGFELCEAMITVDMLRRGGVDIQTVSISDDLTVRSSCRVSVQADILYKDCDPAEYDVLIFPGGRDGTANLEAFDELVRAYKAHYESGKLTCAICAAPSILGHQGMLKGKNYTCFPSFDGEYGGSYQMELAVTDGNLITGRGMGATIEFSRQILKKLVSEEKLKQVEAGMQYEQSFRTM